MQIAGRHRGSHRLLLMSSWPRVALWGRFDVARFGELLLPRIHEAELRRRLPGSRVLPFSPLGPDHPVALDGGLTALRLGAWSPGNAARLAASADAVIVAGTDLLTTDDGALGADYGLSAAEARRRCLSGFFLEGAQPKAPMAWSAAGVPLDFGDADASRLRGALQDARYLSVRDDVSRRRLADVGIERDVTVVPDPVALASRVFEPAVLARRLDYLRLMEWFPREGAPVVLQGSEALAAHAEALATVLTKALAGRDVPVLFLETEPADGGRFVEAMLPRLHGAFRVPASASLVDILAVFSGAGCFVGDSVHGNMAALGFGVPSLFISPGQLAPALATLGDAAPAAAHPADAGEAVARLLGQGRADGLPASIAVRLETHFDALADFADRAQVDRFERDVKPRSRKGIALLRSLQDAEQRLDATRDAWEARSEQVAALRLELAERREKLESDFEGATGEKDRVEARLPASEDEAAALRNQIASSRAERERLEEDLRTVSREVASLQSLLASSHTEREHLEEDLQTASNEIASLRGHLVSSEAERERLEAELDSARGRIGQLTGEHETALTRIAALREDLRRLEGSLEEVQADASRRIAERDIQLAQSLGALEAMRAEFLRFTNLRLFRYTAPLRRLYSSLRRALGLTGG